MAASEGALEQIYRYRAQFPQRQEQYDVWRRCNSLWVLVQSLQQWRSLSTNAKGTLVLMYVSICLYLAPAPQGSRVLSGNTWTRLCLNPFLCCHIFFIICLLWFTYSGGHKIWYKIYPRRVQSKLFLSFFFFFIQRLQQNCCCIWMSLPLFFISSKNRFIYCFIHFLFIYLFIAYVGSFYTMWVQFLF